MFEGKVRVTKTNM